MSKDGIKNRIDSDMKSAPSVLLACDQNHELNLKSKHTYNLKDKNLGNTCKRTSKMNDVSGAVKNSEILIKFWTMTRMLLT